MFASRAVRRTGFSASAAPTRVVDIHSHFLPRTWPDYAKRFGGDQWPWLRHHGEKPPGTYGYGRECSAMLMVGDADFRPVTAACWDVQERLKDLDAMGVGRQIISQTPLLFQWHRDAETASAVARDMNDIAVEMTQDSRAQGRLFALCQVPLQDLDKACQEVSRAKKSGHVGVQIGNHLGPRDLDDDHLVAFLQHCASEDFPVLVHPWDMSAVGPGDRTKAYMMGWTVGMPLETHLSITRMILGGAFDRLPETLRICFAHGGGAFPALLGRMDNAWRERSVARGRAKRPPREYMGRFYVDSAVFDPAVLHLLVKTVGGDRIMLGSDYPFPLGEQKVGDLVRTAPDLSSEVREAILARTAEQFFGLAPQPMLETVPVRVQERAARVRAPPAPHRTVPLPGHLPGPGPLLPPDLRWIASPPLVMKGRGLSSVASQPRSQSSSGFFNPVASGGLLVEDLPHSGRRVHNIIDGKRSWADRGMPLVNPATGEVEGEVACSSAADVAAAVKAASEALSEGSPWRRMSLDARCAALNRLAALMESSLTEVAQAESRDTGKPLALATALDIPRSIANLRFFAGLASHTGGDVHRAQGPLESLSYTVRKPVGVVGIVTPWNLPLYLLTWKLAPALAMGNTIVAKPSELTPTTATLLAEMCTDAGIPPGVVNVVHGEGRDAGQALVSHPGVAAVSFTGGTATGAQVAMAAAPQFKKLSLELGGKNPALVFEDCALDDTVKGLVRSSFLNSGQICLCSSRILVQRGQKDQFYACFLERFVAAVRELVVGRPEDPKTDLGPLSSRAHLAKVLASVEVAREEGGQVLCGGGRPSGAHLGGGFYFEPTVIAGLPMHSATAQNEIFGPVVTVHPFDDEEEAVQLANATRYGLSASIWSESMARMELAERLDAGTVWVNTWLNRELHMPFGGVKDSGVNREGGRHSLDFYSEASTVCVKRGSRAPLPMPGMGGLAPRAAAARGGAGGRRSFSSFAPAGAPRPLGHYVHALQAGGLLFLSGIGPRVPSSDEVPGGPVLDPASGQPRGYDARAQARQCFANVRQVLAAAGCSFADIVDVQVFLVNMRRDFAAFNEVWAEEMAGLEVTRTTIAVQDLPPGGRIAVELKVIAKARPSQSAEA